MLVHIHMLSYHNYDDIYIIHCQSFYDMVMNAPIESPAKHT